MGGGACQGPGVGMPLGYDGVYVDRCGSWDSYSSTFPDVGPRYEVGAIDISLAHVFDNAIGGNGGGEV